MFDENNPGVSYRTVREFVMEKIQQRIFGDREVGSSEYMSRSDAVGRIIRYKVDSLHQIIGRWVRV